MYLEMFFTLQISRFDLAFDCVGDESAVSCLKPGGSFVTVVSPLLSNTDKDGLVLGGVISSLSLAKKASQV